MGLPYPSSSRRIFMASASCPNTFSLGSGNSFIKTKHIVIITKKVNSISPIRFSTYFNTDIDFPPFAFFTLNPTRRQTPAIFGISALFSAKFVPPLIMRIAKRLFKPPRYPFFSFLV